MERPTGDVSPPLVDAVDVARVTGVDDPKRLKVAPRRLAAPSG